MYSKTFIFVSGNGSALFIQSGNDMALACGDPYYMAPASARRMAAELSVLPAWYAEQGGTVWLDSALRMKQWKDNLFAAFGQLDFRIPPHL